MFSKVFWSVLLAFCFILIVGCSFIQKVNSFEEGYQSIFDGKTLNGWDGDSVYWRVENKALVGEVTPKTILKRNSFIIWKGGVVDDFELKTEFRVSPSGNSGINYRSEEVPGIPFALKGYQADIDGGNKYTGQNYEERGRQFLAYRGQNVVIESGGKPKVIGMTGVRDSLLRSIKKGDWNEYHLVVNGSNMKHFINGVLMSEVTDNDPDNRKMKGLLGVQVHVGPPMKVEYRNLRLKKLENLKLL
jgi:hypothetical protein